MLVKKERHKNRTELDYYKTKYDKFDGKESLHLSAYGEPMSMSASVMSSPQKNENNKEFKMEPIPKMADLDSKELEKDVNMLDIDMRQDDFEEFDDFTDQQKEYIGEILDSKLSQQREKMMNYFQNVQLEMLRQFQIQYLELSQVIEKKNK